MSCESISLQRGVQRDDGGITRALSYIYHIYHSTHYFFRSFYSFSLSLSFFFRIFLYSFYLYAERGKGNVIFRLWNSQREAKIWSASISRRERAPECFHTHFDHLFLPFPPNVSSIARKSWDLRVQEPRTEEEVGVYITFARFGRQAWIYIRLIRCIIMVYRICDASMWPRVILSFSFCIQYLSISHPSSLPSFLLWKNLRRRRFLFNETR